MANYRCMGCMKEYEDTLRQCPNCSYIRGTAPAEPYFLAPETVLDGRYAVGKALGSGSVSITYIAWDYNENRKVVIKEYFPHGFATRMPGQTNVGTYDGEKAKQFEVGLRAFLEENTKLTEYSGETDGIVKAERTFIENSTAYLVSEYVEGVTLDKIIQNNRIPWQDAVQIIFPVINSLDMLHNDGLINYNIAPDNIIMTRDKKIKLLGFGGAKLATAGTVKSMSITKPGFSALELYRDDNSSGVGVDVYSLAAVMYYAITGVVPVSAVERVNKDTLKAPSEMGVNIPKGIENAIMNALNVNAQYRTKDCATFAEEINNPDTVRVSEPKKDNSGKLSGKVKGIIIGAAALLISAIVLILVFTKTGTTDYKAKSVLMPDFKGYTEDAVNEELAKDKYGAIQFEIKVIGCETVEDAEEGTVIWQVPEPKMKLTDNVYVIELKLAVAPVEEADKESEVVDMPYLVSRTKADAEAVLQKKGLTNYVFVEKESGSPDGIVCDQSIESGKIIDKTESIVVYISKYKPVVKPAVKPVEKETEKVTKKKPEKTTQKETQKVTEKETQMVTEKETQKVTQKPTQPPQPAKPNKPVDKVTTTTAPTTTVAKKLPDVKGMKRDQAVDKIRSDGFEVANEIGDKEAASSDKHQEVYKVEFADAAQTKVNIHFYVYED